MYAGYVVTHAAMLVATACYVRMCMCYISIRASLVLKKPVFICMYVVCTLVMN